MPHESAGLDGIQRALHDLLNGTGLVLSEDEFLKVVILLDEDNPLPQHFQEAFSCEEALYFLFKVSFLFVLPVEKAIALHVPGDAIVEVNQVRDVEHLRRREELWRFPMVASNLRDACLNS